MLTWQRCIEEYRMISKDTRFMTARIQSEQLARDMLNRKLGHFNVDDFENFLDYCNTEHVPINIYTNQFTDGKRCTRFRRSFVGQNRTLMMEYIQEFNKWIPTLWEANNETESLENYFKVDPIKGSGSSLPTIIMYLKHPEKYNIWFRSLSNAIARYEKKNLKMNRNLKNYQIFNNLVNDSLRRRFGLEPQEIDYILYRIGMENASQPNHRLELTAALREIVRPRSSA